MGKYHLVVAGKLENQDGWDAIVNRMLLLGYDVRFPHNLLNSLNDSFVSGKLRLQNSDSITVPLITETYEKQYLRDIRNSNNFFIYFDKNEDIFQDYINLESGKISDCIFELRTAIVSGLTIFTNRSIKGLDILLKIFTGDKDVFFVKVADAPDHSEFMQALGDYYIIKYNTSAL